MGDRGDRLHRSTRLGAVCLVAVLGTLVLAASAHAGEWMQVSCVNPSGSAAPADGWSGASSGAGNGSNNDTQCAPGSPMFADLSTLTPDPVDSYEMLIYKPPSGSTLIGGTVDVSLYADGGGFDASATAVLYEPAFQYDGSDVFYQCVNGNPPCNNNGTTSDFSGTIPLPANRGGDLFLEAGCGGVPGQTCNTGGSHGAWSLAQLFWAHFLLSNGASPQGSGFTGSALQPGASGTAHLVFTAADPGGPGVYAVTVKVDGTTVWTGTPDNNGGRCVPVGTDSASGALMFDWQQPCPPSEVADVPVPTAQLPDGSHELSVTVTDAAGNSSTVLDQTITTSNHPATPVTTPPPTPTMTPVPRGRGAVQAKFLITWRWNDSHTRLLSISARQVPRGSSVSFSCTGKQCPRRLGSAKAAKLKQLLRRLDGKVFTAGDTVLITVAKRGRKTEHITLKIRWGEIPLVRILPR